jgi:hypothetical protein
MAGDRGDGAVRAEGVFDQPGSREVVGAEQLRMWIAETGARCGVSFGATWC